MKKKILPVLIGLILIVVFQCTFQVFEKKSKLIVKPTDGMMKDSVDYDLKNDNDLDQTKNIIIIRTNNVQKYIKNHSNTILNKHVIISETNSIKEFAKSDFSNDSVHPYIEFHEKETNKWIMITNDDGPIDSNSITSLKTGVRYQKIND